MANFCYRLEQQRMKISNIKLCGKMARAVANCNTHLLVHPNVKWAVISEEFISSLGLELDPCITQIEPCDYTAELLDALSSFNKILKRFDCDVFSYISFRRGTIWAMLIIIMTYMEIVRACEVGSPTMPHKVNPIHVENSEKSLTTAKACSSLFEFKPPDLKVASNQMFWQQLVW